MRTDVEFDAEGAYVVGFDGAVGAATDWFAQHLLGR
jgi:hypothetical protein